MKQHLNILRTKLRPPGIAMAVIRRRLNQRVHEILRKKLALIIAGAGYGKTTLVAQALTDIPADSLWYCLDETDRDFTTFMGYLIAGFKQYLPVFGDGLKEKLSVPRISIRHRRELLVAFLSELESRLSNPMILVLDDYQKVQESPDISESIEFILARMPESLHMIIIGRQAPSFRISRHRAMMEVIDIGEEDLCFDIREIDSLCRECLHVTAEDETIRKLLEKTDGWAAGLILFVSATGTPAPGADCEKLSDRVGSKTFIFQYLEENVFTLLPDDVRHFMLQSSLLSVLDPAFCDPIFGIKNSRDILDYLSQRHLLTFCWKNEPACFRYHQLLREFLERKLEEKLGGEQVRRLHYDIGCAMETSGDIQGAIHHFISGARYDRVCEIISAMLFKDFLDCPFGFLVETFGKIPDDLVRRDPKLLHLGARLASLKGRTRQAIEAIETALNRYRETGNAAGEAACMKDLGFHYYITGDILRAQKSIAALRNTPHADPFFQAEVAGYLILFASILGDMTEADHYYNTACGMYAGDGNSGPSLFRLFLDLCYTNRIHNSGDFIRSDALNRKVLEGFSRLGFEPFLPLANLQAALTSCYLAEWEAGAEFARAGLFMAGKLGIYDHIYAWLLYAKALNEHETSGADQAVSDAEEALDIFRQHENAWGQATVCELLSRLYENLGKQAEAREIVQTGLKVIHGLKLTLSHCALSLRRAELSIENGKNQAALSILDNGREEMDISSFHRFKRDFLYSRIHYARGNREQAVDYMTAGLATAETHRYTPWVLKELRWSIPVLATCHAHRKMTGYIEAVMRLADPEKIRSFGMLRGGSRNRIGTAVRKLIAVIPPKEPKPLRIICLGKFCVSVGDRDIPRRNWRSTKAELIFKFLVLKTGQGYIPKDILMELAWPGDHADKAVRGFHVALTSLRKVLEPDLERGVASAYLLRKNDAYRLEIGRNGLIDFQEFLRLAGDAEKVEKKDPAEAIDLYRVSESMYSGRLFEEDPYQDCFTEDRDRIHERYLHLLMRIMHLLEKKALWKECILYAEKYLTADKYAEPIYCALMRYYARLGDTPKIVGTFHRCRAAVMEDLDSPLSVKTINLYRRLALKR